MARTSPEETAWLRGRFSCWLGAALCDTSKARLAATLYGKAANGKALGRSTLGALSHGARTPTANLAWKVGDGLQKCGVAWSSGPVAVYAAGHHATVIAALAHLAEMGEVTTALDLFAALPLAVEVEVDALIDGSSLEDELLAFDVVNGRELPISAARSFLSESVARVPHEKLSKAHERAIAPDAMRGIKSVNAREAYRIASSSIAPDRARDLAWLLLEDWATEFVEPWDTDGRAEWCSFFEQWRKATRTTAHAARERRRATARDLRRTPEDRAKRDRFEERRKAERGGADIKDALVVPSRATK